VIYASNKATGIVRQGKGTGAAELPLRCARLRAVGARHGQQ